MAKVSTNKKTYAQKVAEGQQMAAEMGIFDVGGNASGIGAAAAGPSLKYVAPPPAAGSFGAPVSSVNPTSMYNYSSGNLADPANLRASTEALTNQGRMPAATAAGPDYMGMLRQLMGQFSGPAPTMSFDPTPYANAIANVQQQGALGQQAIARNTADFTNALGGIRSQYNTRQGEDAAMLQAMQQRALQNAQGANQGVLADLAAQGVNTTMLQGLQNNRVGNLQDLAVLQNATAQRSAENTRNTMDATQRSAAGTGAGALNTLTQNVQTATGQIGAAQAKAAQAAQDQYLRALSQYQSNQAGNMKSALGILNGLGLDDDPEGVKQELRDQYVGSPGDPTSQAVLEVFDNVDTGSMTPAAILAQFQQKVDDPANPGKQVTGAELATRKGVHVPTVTQALKTYTKKPKAKNVATKALFGL